jgi:hypothetical protein
MLRATRRRLWISWIAIAAILLSGLAPVVSHAINSRNAANDVWHQICTPQGSSLVAATDNSSAPDPTDKLSAYCQLCLLSPAHWAPSPQKTQLRLAPNSSQGFSPSPVARVRSSLVWTTPPSRAPPPVS